MARTRSFQAPHITIRYLAELMLFSRKLCTARLGLGAETCFCKVSCVEAAP